MGQQTGQISSFVPGWWWPCLTSTFTTLLPALTFFFAMRLQNKGRLRDFRLTLLAITSLPVTQSFHRHQFGDAFEL